MTQPPSTARPLMLFDVDGTMLSGSVVVHYDALLHGIKTATGAQLPFSYNNGAARIGDTIVNGATDYQATDACLTDLRIPEDEIDEKRNLVFRAMADRYLELLDDGAFAGEVHPGVIDYLLALKESGVAIAVLTGGIKTVALRRLTVCGLDVHFPTGAFGDDGVDRAALFAPAIRNAEVHYGTTFGNSIGYIGDTWRDVHAAKAAGVKSVAVATGYQTRAELEGAGADLVFDRLGRDALAPTISLLRS